jgi:hypothetical protein
MIFIIIWFDIASEEIELNANPFNPFFMSATNNLLSEAVMKDISLAALLISTLNTFFRPSTQLARAIKNLHYKFLISTFLNFTKLN